MAGVSFSFLFETYNRRRKASYIELSLKKKKKESQATKGHLSCDVIRTDFGTGWDCPLASGRHVALSGIRSCLCQRLARGGKEPAGSSSRRCGLLSWCPLCISPSKVTGSSGHCSVSQPLPIRRAGKSWGGGGSVGPVRRAGPAPSSRCDGREASPRARHSRGYGDPELNPRGPGGRQQGLGVWEPGGACSPPTPRHQTPREGMCSPW